MIAICLFRQFAFAQEAVPNGELKPTDKRACVFADDKAGFIYASTAPRGAAAEHFNWQVEWSLVVGNRTLKRGSSKVVVPGDSDIPLYLIGIPMPPLRNDVVMPVELRMTWRADDSVYQDTRQLYLFSRDPFATRQKFLEDARISLFDSEGKTAEVLDEHEIPYARLLDLAAVDLVTEGILLVGEGVSFREQRKLAESLIMAAQRGVAVLCLAPREGDVPLSVEQNGKMLRPNRLMLEREEIVRHYDKRFDSLHTLSPLVLSATRSGSVVQAASWEDNLSRRDHWSWLDMEFPNKTPKEPDGRLIVCGLGLISDWDASPVPRYLFLRLLEECTEAQPVLEKSNEIIQR